MSFTCDSKFDHTSRANIMRIVNEPLIDMARGVLPGRTIIHKFGENHAVGTGAEEDIWSYGGTYTFPTAAETVRVKSGGDANDTAAGSGARTIRVIGLDENWEEQSEDITLAGASASSSTTTTFIRVYRAYVLTVGTYGGYNAGAITVENTSSNDILAYIEAEHSQSTTTVYTVPANKTGYLLYALAIVEASKPCNLVLYQRQNADNTSTYSPRRVLTTTSAFVGAATREFYAGIVLPAKTDIWMAGQATTSTANVSGSYDIILYDDV